MEVLTFFYTDTKLVTTLDHFLSTYDKLSLNGEDEDTKYFINPKTGRNEIYFHYKFNNVENDFILHFSEMEQNFIKKYYNNKQFYFLDIQYKDNNFLKILLIEFQKYIKNNHFININNILLGHSLQGIVTPLTKFNNLL